MNRPYTDPNDPALYGLDDMTIDGEIVQPLTDDDLIDDPGIYQRTYDTTHTPQPLPPTPPNPTHKRTATPHAAIWQVWGFRLLAGARRWWCPAGWWAARWVLRHRTLTVLLLCAVVWGTALTWLPTLGTAVAVAAATWAIEDRATRRERVASLASALAYHKQRARIRRKWAKLWHNSGLTSPPLHRGETRRMPKWSGARPHRLGVTVLVRGEDVAVGPRQITANAHTLTETVGASSLRVSREPDRTLGPLLLRRGRTRVDFKFRDPFPSVIRPEDLPRSSKPGQVVIGLDEEGHGLEKSYLLPSLIVGAPGAGKSSEVWIMLRALRMARIPIRLRVFDPKGGMELGDLRDAAYTYESNPARWPQFLRRCCRALQARQAELARQGLRKIPLGDPEWPLDIMIIDELVTVLAMSRGPDARINVFGQNMSAKEAFTVYLSQIRSAGATCIALSQLSEKNVLGTARGMFAYVSCLRVGPTESETVDMLLGRGAHNAYPAHELPADETSGGKGWVRTKAGILMYRAAYLDDAAREVEAQAIAEVTQKYEDDRAREVARDDAHPVPAPARRTRGAHTRPDPEPVADDDGEAIGDE